MDPHRATLLGLDRSGLLAQHDEPYGTHETGIILLPRQPRERRHVRVGGYDGSDRKPARVKG